MSSQAPQPCVVVGIDGSRAAIDAALWAVDEAVARDIPLRLLYAIEPEDFAQTPPDRPARKLTIAENAVRYASRTTEAADKPVRIEIEIAQEPPTIALTRASASAAMVCVGAVGLHHFRPERAGSTAAAVAQSAHCPVAVIRRHGDQARLAEHWIAVDSQASADSDAVMKTALEEARLRDLPLRAIDHGQGVGRDYPDRRLERWRRHYPDVDVQTSVARGSLLEYVAGHGRKVQMVVLGHRNHDAVQQLLGPAGNAVLHNADCSLLIVDRPNL
ncbi:universal stress protein [Mycobacterium camsae]|uniref:universal stress protein n=1 Tax=Mycobacterium gordonae TaxID=1778 RepID=UPI0019800E64|nr:universal stress protein [Mycobacterium gordonae]